MMARVRPMDESKKTDQSKCPHPRVETLGMRAPVARGAKAFSADNPPPRSSGRPKGARNKVGGDLKGLILQAALETGFIRKNDEGEMIGTGEEGIKGYLKWAAINRADRFLALLSRVIPFHLTADLTHRMLTQTEAETELMQLGLPVGLLESLRAQNLHLPPERLDDDESPENPYAPKVVDVTPES